MSRSELGGRAVERVGMNALGDYGAFLQGKVISDPPTGLAKVPVLNAALYPFQREIVAWALKRGRAAIWADCGLGKTPMQLEWARHVPGKVLVLAPLAVAQQTVREGVKFGIEVVYARKQSDASGQITITNYEMLTHFAPGEFAGIVLDESSILKSYMGRTKRQLLEVFKHTRFRLACTATPAPNDHMELGNHAEFLGVMPSNEMLARWFINDSMEAGNYRVKAHGERDFWRWVSSWAVALGKPSDIGEFDDAGFVLPRLDVRIQSIASAPPPGMLFHTGDTLSAAVIHRVKRDSAAARAQVVAEFVSASNAQCLIWCDSNYEADAIRVVIPHAIDVRGSDNSERKEAALLDFAMERTRVLVTKPSLAGFGMNFQNCHRIAFVGLSYSFEMLYQAVRRVWRFGQRLPVECLIVETEAEAGIRGVVDRKIEDHAEMQRNMIANMKEFQTMMGKTLMPAPAIECVEGENYSVYLGDCVRVMGEKCAAESIDFSIFSPPFANLYIYSESLHDMGNSADSEEFFAHMKFMIQQLHRVTVNGRLAAVHCKDLPSYMGRDGAAGLIDFPGACIRAFEAEGWQYHSRVTIWKDPVTEMQRTKNHGLLHKQLCKDSAASRQGMADYLIVFRKWGTDPFVKPVRGVSSEIRFDSYVGEDIPKNSKSPRDYSIQVWQRYASPVWFDIRQQNVLQGSRYASSDEDERHICPLQLDVIERAIHLWSNEGDVVFSPFAGIGSEGYMALKMGRRFVGVELKRSYWAQAARNIASAKSKQQGLFDAEPATVTA